MASECVESSVSHVIFCRWLFVGYLLALPRSSWKNNSTPFLLMIILNFAPQIPGEENLISLRTEGAFYCQLPSTPLYIFETNRILKILLSASGANPIINHSK